MNSATVLALIILALLLTSSDSFLPRRIGTGIGNGIVSQALPSFTLPSSISTSSDFRNTNWMNLRLSLKSYKHIIYRYSGNSHRATALDLYKVPNDWFPEAHKVGNTTDQRWTFYLLEKRDLPAAVDLATECFFKPRLVLNSKGMFYLEKLVSEAIFSIFNIFDTLDYKWNNYWGIRSRSGSRLAKPSFDVSKDSFVLVALSSNVSPPSSSSYSYTSPPFAGMVEICLEEANGKLAPPFALPFRTQPNDDDQPYLCNLCVGTKYRRLGLGKLLCKISEDLVQKHWNKSSMFLHVEKDNLPAKVLYSNMGYRITEGLSYWETKFFGMEDVLYYSKRF